MKIISEYITYHGEVGLIADTRYYKYKVVFISRINPAASYRRVLSGLTYDQACEKFNAIAEIYKKHADARCGFYARSKIKCNCAIGNCPKIFGGEEFWKRFSYDCKYRVKSR